MADALFEQRRKATELRLDQLRSALTDAAALADGRACVYATGSFARKEASAYSDLDLFIVGRGRSDSRELSHLDEILIEADLIRATRTLKIPEFSGDGEYLRHYTVDEIVRGLGGPEDDARNTFTARMLLLLESVAVIGVDTYDHVIDEVLAAYWRDYEDHRTDFVPGFLANDILRLWRTFCVNYEARTTTEPADKKAKRKLKNYKLKHSRLLTCYSTLASLLATFKEHGTVSPQHAKEIAGRTPTDRLRWLMDCRQAPRWQEHVRSLLEMYEQFLSVTDSAEGALIERFLDRENSRELFAGASRFGDAMFALLDSIGRDASDSVNRFYRQLVV